MASGLTYQMRAISRYARSDGEPWVQKDRDRSLAGKKRIKARKASNNK